MIVKCDVPNCCKPWRSSWKKYFPQRYIPKPYFSSLAQRLGYIGSKISMEASFDLYCPSISQKKIDQRTCKTCKIYHASKASVKRHKCVFGNIINTTSEKNKNDDENNDTHLTVNESNSDQIHVIENIFDWMKSPFDSMVKTIVLTIASKSF